jgi:hypothetical protein
VTKGGENQMMNNKLGLIAALAVLTCGGVQAKDPVAEKLDATRRVQEFDSKTPQRPAPQAHGEGNQYGGNVGVTGVRIAPGIQGNAEVTAKTQPRITPTGGNVGVEVKTK